MYSPTLEQQEIIDAIIRMLRGELVSGSAGGSIKCFAGAGAGKTSTIISSAHEVKAIYHGIKILYLAYNREIKQEAAHKFEGLAEAHTIHGMAYKQLKLYSIGRRLGNLHSGHIRAVLGRHVSDTDVNLVQKGLFTFCSSPDSWPDESHIPKRNGPSAISQDKRIIAAELLGKLFEEISPETRKSDIPLPFDVYLKYWQIIGSPGLDQYDLILMDEAQDANPVVLAALEGAGRAVYVGDSHQAIYQWRNAIDALQSVYGPAYPMTQSFRFGPVIADLANTILSYKSEKPEFMIRGFNQLQTTLGPVRKGEQHARIFRTNLALIREALVLNDQLVPFSIAGNNDEIASLIKSVKGLKEGNRADVRHALARHAKTWANAEKLAEDGNEGKELTQAVRIVNDFDGRVDEILDILKRPADEQYARIILTTAHRSKGREWDSVVIGPDFDPILDRAKEAKRTWDPEMNLLYVAATRAMRRLDVRCEWLRNLL